MILLVDKSLEWPETSVPTFYYDKKVPVLEIGQFLRPYEEKELEIFRREVDMKKINLDLRKALKTDPNIFEKHLLKLFNIQFPIELQALMHEYFRIFGNTIEFVFFSHYNFISSIEFLTNLRKLIKTTSVNETLNFQRIKSNYSFLEEKYLKILLRYLGYDFKYKSLVEEELIFKKDKKIVPKIV